MFAGRDMPNADEEHNWWSLPLHTVIVRKEMCEKQLTVITPEWQSIKINYKIITTTYTLK